MADLSSLVEVTNALVDLSTSRAEPVMQKTEYHEIVDPFVDDDKQGLDAYIEELAAIALDYLGVASPLDLIDNPQHPRKSAVDEKNPATQMFIRDVDQAKEWLQLVPTARALEPMTNLDAGQLTPGVPLQPGAIRFFRNCADAVGLRSRQTMATSIIETELTRVCPARRLRVLSLACGAAKAILELLSRNEGRCGVTSELTLVDADRHALEIAKITAAKLAFSNLRVMRRNIVDLHGFRQAHVDRASMQMLLADIAHGHMPSIAGLSTGSFDVVDIMGFFEYL